MAYKIDYIPVGKRQYVKPILPRWVVPTATVILLLTAYFGITIRYGSSDWLLPGDPKVTKAAMEELIDQLRSGEQLTDAVTAFCREVLQSAP